ncbi:MAG: hypothetical protein KC469_10615 [Flavobacteriaceae bacterium]|nr:hypothetical protein [Flavobacteriaceae bacterium]
MKAKITLVIISIFMLNTVASQNEKLPYYEIPEASDNYTAGTVVARMIDGLGFRYYWATEGLRDEDLAFKPSEDSRTTGQTVDHILGLTNVILNSALKKGGEALSTEGMTFAEKRALTLNMLKQAADVFRVAEDLSQFKIVFNRGGKTSEYPFWNQINGPIADAIWHTGQIITHRRTSGNPYNSKASVFTGKVGN